MFKNTFGCKVCKTEYQTKDKRDQCMFNHKLTPEKRKEIEDCQKRGLENFKRAFQ